MKKLSILIVLALILGLTSMAFAAKVDQQIQDEMTYKNELNVIIVFEAGGKGKVNPHALGGTVKHEYNLINGFAGRFPTQAIKGLINNPNVKYIAADHKKEATLHIGAPTISAPTAWSYGYTGNGIKVAVIDSGIDSSHPALAGRIVGWYDTINGQSQPYDDNGHGTHCAGIVGSHDSTYTGVAPDVDLMGVKVLDAGGSGYDSDIIAGIEWAVNNGADVISMSIGGKPFAAPANDPVCVALVNAWNQGVISAVAAGNSGPRPKSIDSPGIEPTIITVAATDDQDTTNWTDDDIARFSSVGPTKYGDAKPDLAAPGAAIVSCDANTTGWVSYSGTSMATPHVAGAIALILEANPTWTPDQVKAALMNTANDLGLDWNHQGAGEIDVWSAINY